MKVEIITSGLRLDISGISGVAANKNYAGTAFALMDKLWPVIRSKGLKHKGLNIWVYEPHEKVFAGVELEYLLQKIQGLNKRQSCFRNMLTVSILDRIASSAKRATICEMKYTRWDLNLFFHILKYTGIGQTTKPSWKRN